MEITVGTIKRTFFVKHPYGARYEIIAGGGLFMPIVGVFDSPDMTINERKNMAVVCCAALNGCDVSQVKVEE